MKLNRVKWVKHPMVGSAIFDPNGRGYSEVGTEGWDLGSLTARKMDIFGIPITDIDGFNIPRLYLSVHPFYKVVGEKSET